MTNTSALTKLAATQFGVVSRAQARSLGLSKDQAYRLKRTGFWRVVHPGVHVVSGFPPSFEQRTMAAIAWAGPTAAASHRAAARLLELDIQRNDVDITAPLRRNKVPEGICLHRSALAFGDRATVRGIPVTSATRTLLDLGSVATTNELELALEAALRHRLTSVPTLQTRLGTEARGRRGVAPLRKLLSIRENDASPTESFLETRFARFARENHLPKMDRQFEIFDGDRFIARVDFAIPDASLAIEVLGYRWHSGRKQWHQDHARLNRLAQMGWRVIFVTKESLDAPANLACDIRDALGQTRLFG